MRNLPFALGLLVVLGLGTLGCSDSTNTLTIAPSESYGPQPMSVEDPCGDPLVVPLLAGQHIDIGTVVVSNDGSFLEVQFSTTYGWVFTETHLAVATSLYDIPLTQSGNPKVGLFSLSTDHDPAISYFSYSVDLLESGYDTGDTLFIAAHAAVLLLDEGDDPVQEETAWADGLEFPGNSWATYFTYVVQPCNGGGEEGGEEGGGSE